MSQSLLYPFSWHIQEQDIQVYGWNERNEWSCVHIKGFTPYMYLKLPSTFSWTSTYEARLLAEIRKKVSFVKAQVAHLRGIYNNVHQPKNPYLFIAFKSDEDRKKCVNLVRRPLPISGIGTIEVFPCENRATPVLQFICHRNITTVDWFSFEHTNEPSKEGSTLVYESFWRSINPTDKQPQSPSPLIMSFDI